LTFKKHLTQRRKERKERQKNNSFLFSFAFFAPLREVLGELPTFRSFAGWQKRSICRAKKLIQDRSTQEPIPL
jgi:hypothetical protein